MLIPLLEAGFTEDRQFRKGRSCSGHEYEGATKCLDGGFQLLGTQASEGCGSTEMGIHGLRSHVHKGHSLRLRQEKRTTYSPAFNKRGRKTSGDDKGKKKGGRKTKLGKSFSGQEKTISRM